MRHKLVIKDLYQPNQADNLTGLKKKKKKKRAQTELRSLKKLRNQVASNDIVNELDIEDAIGIASAELKSLET